MGPLWPKVPGKVIPEGRELPPPVDPKGFRSQHLAVGQAPHRGRPEGVPT
jgi:hypothetical protein